VPWGIATKRLSVDGRGRVVYRYRQPFRDGSTHVLLEPLDFMFRMNGMPRARGCARAAIARQAALVPRPRLNLTRFHGVFAPNCTHRACIVPRQSRRDIDADKPTAPMNRMQRLKRDFAIGIETCPHCGGKLRVIACIEEPWLIRRILAHVQGRDDPAGATARGPPGHCEDALGVS
jgi:hypothetical protein